MSKPSQRWNLMPRGATALAIAAGLLVGLAGGAQAQRAAYWEQARTDELKKIGHIIVIYEENHSFDKLFGTFPGANGIANASATAKTQVDLNGNPYARLPDIMNTNFRPAIVDTRFPASVANGPFRIDAYVAQNVTTGDLVHRYIQEQVQIDGGKMDKFAAVSDSGGLSMGFYDMSQSNIWKLAQSGALLDNAFHSAFGGSFMNHAWLSCACSFTYPNAPSNLIKTIGANGLPVVDAAILADGTAVDTIRSVQLHAPSDTNLANLLPPQTATNIGDLLTAKGVNWAYYAGGYNDAVAGKPAALFQFHHQPFAYYANSAPTSDYGKAHLKDYVDFQAALANGTLPPVAFYKPIGELNLHPGYADVTSGDAHLADVIAQIQRSPVYADSLIVITFDEHGGAWDHVAPPVIDKWGPGSRVPFIVLGPFARAGYVDHTQYETVSILKTIEDRYDLRALGTRDAAANNLRNALTF